MKLIIVILVWVCGLLVSNAYATSVSPTEILSAIKKVESGGNPYAIRDNTGNRSYFPKSLSEAVEQAKRLLALGHNIDLGLYQINSIHLNSGLPLDTIFNLAVQESAATKIFNDFHKQAKAIHGDTDLALWRATGAYNAGNAALYRDNVPYVSRVLAVLGLAPDAGNRGGWTQGSAQVRTHHQSTGNPTDLQIPSQWQIGTEIGDPKDSTENHNVVQMNRSNEIAATIGFISLTVIIVVFLKLGLLWWLLKLLAKKVLAFTIRQMTKHRSLSF